MRDTTFSECRKYRYTLWREWPVEELMFLHGQPKEIFPRGFAMFIGLNPSTADETKDDPTIRKCIGFSKRWGYSALCMTNLFAFRATDPKVMKRELAPIGPDNDTYLIQCASTASVVIAAWGTNGCHIDRDLLVKGIMQKASIELRCLRKTKAGHPEHPLYVPYEVTPIML